jgi:HTH-type transcriptional regulator/antitoxin MqsA
MPKTETYPCPSCGSPMTFEKREDVLSYGGKEKRIKVQGWWCKTCNEAVFEGIALVARERAYLELKAEVDNVLGPSDVAKVREHLGLSQRRAGELLGGGPRAFQKYESGKQAVSVPMSHLLTLLMRDPKRLKEIESTVVAKKAPRGPSPTNRKTKADSKRAKSGRRSTVSDAA